MRIRSIKPEFWKSQKLARLPRDARLLFAGLWNLADDHGRFRAHPRLVAGELFPYENDDDLDVAGCMQVLADSGFITLYEHGGQRYGHVRNFEEHQKIDKRAASRLPPPSGGGGGGGTPIHAEEQAEPANIPAEPAETSGLEQGAGSREVPTPTPSAKAGGARRDPEPDRAARGGAGASRRGDRKRAARAPETETADTGEPQSPAAMSSSSTSNEAQARPPAPPPGDPDPVIRLQEALTRTPYRSALPTMKRRWVLKATAEKLAATGLTADLLNEVAAIASDRGDDAGGLLAHWLDGNTWREVLDERAAKDRHAAARARPAAESNGEPMHARSALEDAVKAAAERRA